MLQLEHPCRRRRSRRYRHLGLRRRRRCCRLGLRRLIFRRLVFRHLVRRRSHERRRQLHDGRRHHTCPVAPIAAAAECLGPGGGHGGVLLVRGDCPRLCHGHLERLGRLRLGLRHHRAHRLLHGRRAADGL